MKTVISLMLVSIGLGLDANGSENAEIALGLCFFFGAINLAMPLTSFFSTLSHSIFHKKPIHAKRHH